MTKINDEKLKFIELRAKGLSFDKCAQELGKSKNTLIDWNRELADDIGNLKAMALEALYDEFYLTKEAKIRNLAKIRQALTSEIEKRDLSSISTDKLIELAIKVENKLGEEIIEPKFIDSRAKFMNEINRGLG